MNELTFEERSLLCLYSGGGTRQETIAALMEMRGYLEPDETELRTLTDSTLAKLHSMSDQEYEALDLFPDFTVEDFIYGE